MDYAFPYRLESINLLQKAIAANPNDRNAHYLLGTLLASKGRLDEALEFFTKSNLLGLNYDVLHHNIAEIHWQQAQDLKKAAYFFERAYKLNPKNWQNFEKLDRIYKELGLNKKRLELYKSLPAEMKARDRVRIGHVMFGTDKYAEFLKTLTEN